MLREDLGMSGYTEEQHLSEGGSQISNILCDCIHSYPQACVIDVTQWMLAKCLFNESLEEEVNEGTR